MYQTKTFIWWSWGSPKFIRTRGILVEGISTTINTSKPLKYINLFLMIWLVVTLFTCNLLS